MTEPQEREPRLQEDAQGLALVAGDLVLRADFKHLVPRIRPDRLGRELVVRAARIKGADPEKPLKVIDATAGLGEDSFLLAAAGFTCTLFERDPAIAALLRYAMEQGAEDPVLAPILSRLHLVEEDSIPALHEMGVTGDHPDVILLDPMFPARTKSALVKKKFQMLQQLEQPCEDEEELLQAALAARPRKLVIKRPAKGPYLGSTKPDYSLSGKSVRYDCLAFAWD